MKLANSRGGLGETTMGIAHIIEVGRYFITEIPTKPGIFLRSSYMSNKTNS